MINGYRPPVRVRPSLVRGGSGALRAPAPATATAPISPFDLASVVKMVQELHMLHASMKDAIEKAGSLEEVKKIHADGSAKIAAAQASFEAIKKGPQGVPGLNAKEVDLNEVARRAAALVPKPAAGKDAEAVVIDEKRIAKRAAKYIKLPKVAPVAAIDPDTILQQVVEMLKGGKVRLHVNQLDGFEQTIAPIRSLAAKNGGIRGGGDTVKAGTNVTITTNGSGQKVINASGGGGLTPFAVTGTIDDSNKTFTSATLPTLLNINGAFYQQAGGSYTWSYAGTTITLNAAVGTGGSIFGV